MTGQKTETSTGTQRQGNHVEPSSPQLQTRSGGDRRKSVVDMRNDPTGLERRRGPGRRRSDFAKAAEEGQMSPEQFLFIMAIDAYKRVNQKPFPTWTEVLEVIRKLGYRKTCASQLQLPNAEDWTEQPDAAAFAAGGTPGGVTGGQADAGE